MYRRPGGSSVLLASISVHSRLINYERYMRRVNDISLLWSFLIVFGVLAIDISPLRGCFSKNYGLNSLKSRSLTALKCFPLPEANGMLFSTAVPQLWHHPPASLTKGHTLRRKSAPYGRYSPRDEDIGIKYHDNVPPQFLHHLFDCLLFTRGHTEKGMF